MKRPRKPSASDGLASLADVLPAICTDLALDRKVNEMAVLALWPRQLEALFGPDEGSHIAARTRAIRLQRQGGQTVLHVRVADAALASELGFHLADLASRLNAFAPQTGIRIDRIRLLVGDM